MPRPAPTGVAIRIFLVDGTPQGLRVAERLGWTGLCLAFSRADYETARQRPELLRTGTYLLLGADPEDDRNQRAYIGEGDVVRTRLDSHYREKDFWSNAFVLTTTDDSLNKAQVRYLEARFINLAREAANSVLDNGTSPEPTWLSEPDIAVMDTYLNYALDLLPLLGVVTFELVSDVGPAIGSAAIPESLESAPAPLNLQSRPNLFLNTVLAVAEGRDDPRGFIVVEGSTARKQESVMSPGYLRLRERLIEDGTLEPLNQDQYRLARNFVFDSPSAAASVLSGGSKNGRTVWKDAHGTTLKELETRAVDSAIAESLAAGDTRPPSVGDVSPAGGVVGSTGIPPSAATTFELP